MKAAMMPGDLIRTLVLGACFFLIGGCLRFSTPARVLEHRQAIADNLKVEIDISSASNFTGDVGSVLRHIEKNIQPLPERYREKIGTIKVVDSFLGDYLFMAPFVGGFTSNDGTIHVRNANPTRFVQAAVMFSPDGVLLHEIMHSVHQQELRHWKQEGRPTPEFAAFIRDWELLFLGDVNRDGLIDDNDTAYIEANPREYDANGDGVVNHKDVELAIGRPYVNDRWLSLQGMTVLFQMSFDWLTPRPGGYATPYARTYVWEDAAETKRWAWHRGIIPGIYSGRIDAERIQRAWDEFHKLQRSDKVLARKVFILARYIAAHEPQENLNGRWLDEQEQETF